MPRCRTSWLSPERGSSLSFPQVQGRVQGFMQTSCRGLVSGFIDSFIWSSCGLVSYTIVLYRLLYDYSRVLVVRPRRSTNVCSRASSGSVCRSTFRVFRCSGRSPGAPKEDIQGSPKEDRRPTNPWVTEQSTSTGAPLLGFLGGLSYLGTSRDLMFNM